MRRKWLFPAVLALLLSVALIAAACGDDDDDDATTAAEATTLTLTGAQTTLALDAGTAGILTDNGIEVAPVDPATAGDDGISFPITGGEVDADTLAGTIDHSGGLAFTAGGTTLELTDFVIDTAAGTLTATAAGDQVVILDVDLTGLQRTDGDAGIELTGITTTLSADGADALNATFDVELFEQGIPIGDVTVLATA